MKFTWIYILSFAVLAVSCAPAGEPEASSIATDVADAKKDADEQRATTLEDQVDLEDAENDLPILPPIILIDFTNGTANLTSEEKAKRTINGNLGYGFQPNNLFAGKYNYYFPGGKTGTTVSIEESISPFLPTTIIEKENNPTQQSQSYAFGDRVKFQKTTQANGNNFQSYSRIPSVTQRPNFAGYATQKPAVDLQSSKFSPVLGSYKNPSQNYQSYSSPAPPSQFSSQVFQQQYQPYNSPIQNYESFGSTGLPPVYNSPSFSQQQRQQQFFPYSTPAPLNYPSQGRTTVLSPVSGTPKYSYENGIKYEHKIVWRYPNGMVSDIAPNPYPEYSNPPTKAALPQNFPSPGSGFSVNSNAEGIYSQKPATFPQDVSSEEDDTKPSQFVSSASISDGVGSYASTTPAPPLQKYSFQTHYSIGGINGQFPQNQGLTGPVKSTFDNPKALTSYPIDSPEAEFPGVQGYQNREIFGTANGYEQLQNSDADTSSGRLQPSIQLSKYSPQVQQYLKKALGLGENGSGKSHEYNAATNGDLRYSSLLDYNPSISQYIGNPSSILNAQPTFIQAGGSLIPVIILRVDGVPPIQPKQTPNINLKALLQKYLTQYAQTVTTLSQGREGLGQGYGGSRAQGSSSSELGSFDLGELTRGLGQLGRPDPTFKQNFAQSFAQSIARSAESYQPGSFSGQSSYEEFKNPDTKYASPVPRETTTRKPKVKSVQIIEEPRYTSYKPKN